MHAAESRRVPFRNSLSVLNGKWRRGSVKRKMYNNSGRCTKNAHLPVDLRLFSYLPWHGTVFAKKTALTFEERRWRHTQSVTLWSEQGTESTSLSHDEWQKLGRPSDYDEWKKLNAKWNQNKSTISALRWLFGILKGGRWRMHPVCSVGITKKI